MNWYYNQKISVKLLIGFVTVAFISALVAMIGAYNIKVINDNLEIVIQDNLQELGPLAAVQTNLDSTRVNLRNMLLDERNQEKYIEQMRIADREAEKGLSGYSGMIQTEQERMLYNDAKSNIDKYFAVRDRIIDLARSGQKEQAIRLLLTDAVPPATAAIQKIKEIFDFNYRQAEERAAANSNVAQRSFVIMFATAVMAVILAIGLGMLIARSISRPIARIVAAADSIAQGNLAVTLHNNTKDEVGVLANSFERIIGALRSLVADTNTLASAAADGKLTVRVDAEKHSGDYRRIVEGINQTLDAVIEPLHMAADYVDKISSGNIPPLITANYHGDFNAIKINLNNCINNINALVSDADMLVQAALTGNLSTRADVSKHNGEYRKIVEGVNKTLDAVIAPIEEAAFVLREMAGGKLHVRVTGKYMGDHAAIKDTLNATLDAISSYIEEISRVLGEMANSNLDITIRNEYKGDFAQIKEALNLIIASFNEVISSINQSADEVASGSRQVSEGSQSLSQGTTEQASAIEQLTVSVGQIAGQTKDNAMNANQANSLSLTVKDNAGTGFKRMEEMLLAMAEINDSSGNISKIIKVIDEIAFQTNILALNAAVEAARAGQHGKGFAVVAEEVRNLAARSANAAKDTTMLIESSIKKVEYGTEIANGTARSLQEIVDGVGHVSELVAEIAAASNEQATAIAQINKGVEQVSLVVQNNSATAEQSAAASAQLSAQAERLKEMISVFRLQSAVHEVKFGRYEMKGRGMGEETSRGSMPFSPRSVYRDEAAATLSSNRTRISLSDRDFGKY